MDNLVTQYGIYGLIVGFVTSQVWPWIRDKVFPAYAAERKQAAQRVSDHDERVLKAFEGNTTVMTRLDTTLQAVNASITVNHTQVLARLDDIEDKVDVTMTNTTRMLDRMGEKVEPTPRRRAARTQPAAAAPVAASVAEVPNG